MNRTPDLSGDFGRAWRVDLEKRSPEERKSSLELWAVHRPGTYPFAEWFIVSVVSLKQLEGLPPAWRKYPEAEFELMVMMTDPAQGAIDADAKDLSFKVISCEIVEQFHGTDEAQAKELGRLAVKAVVNGLAQPDCGYAGLWKVLVRNTVEHLVIGGHPKGQA